MTMHVDSITSAAHGLEFEVVSPELALVDPELGQAARALLADPVESARARLVSVASIGDLAALEWTSGPRAPTARQRTSRRLLVGVAAATVLALLLLDVRVEVGQRPAAAEPDVASETPLASSGTKQPGASSRAGTTRPPIVRAQPANAARKFAWAPSPGASGYHVEFFSGSERVFGKDTTGPTLTVPPHWTFGGKRRSLRGGEYGWYVWPIVGGRRQSRAVVQTTISIPNQ